MLAKSVLQWYENCPSSNLYKETDLQQVPVNSQIINRATDEQKVGSDLILSEYLSKLQDSYNNSSKVVDDNGEPVLQ